MAGVVEWMGGDLYGRPGPHETNKPCRKATDDTAPDAQASTTRPDRLDSAKERPGEATACITRPAPAPEVQGNRI